MLQMSSMMREGGAGTGAADGPGLFGAMGGTPNVNANPNPAAAANPPFNPSLWPPFPQPNQGAAATGAGAGAGATGGAGGRGTGAGAGLVDPALIQQLLGGLGSGAGGGGIPGMGGLVGGFGGAPQPTDTRSPEERFQVQLQVRTPMHSNTLYSPY